MKNKKGSTIVWAVMLIMVLMVIVGASLSFAYMSYNQSVKNRNKTQVELIANSAIKSLVSVIEEGNIEIPTDTNPKQIASMKLIDGYTNEDYNNFGSISDIYIKRKTENGKVALAYLTANYADEKYTIYAYLVKSNNNWKCVQYDTNGNRDITVKDTGSDSGNTGGNTGDNTGSTTTSTAINTMFKNATLLMHAYYDNNCDINKFKEWYKTECEKNGSTYVSPEPYQFNTNYELNAMYNILYNQSKFKLLQIEDFFHKGIKTIRNDNNISKTNLRISMIVGSPGSFIVTGNAEGEDPGASGVYLLSFDDTIYIKKSDYFYDYDKKTLEQLRQIVQNTNEWQVLQ